MQASFPDEETARKRVREEMVWIKRNLVQGHIGKGSGEVEAEAGKRGTEVETECEIIGGPEIGEHQTFVQTAPGPGRESGSDSRQRERQREFPSLSSFVISLRMFIPLPLHSEHSNHLVPVRTSQRHPTRIHKRWLSAGCLESRIGLVRRLRLGRPEWVHLQEDARSFFTLTLEFTAETRFCWCWI